MHVELVCVCILCCGLCLDLGLVWMLLCGFVSRLFCLLLGLVGSVFDFVGAFVGVLLYAFGMSLLWGIDYLI